MEVVKKHRAFVDDIYFSPTRASSWMCKGLLICNISIILSNILSGKLRLLLNVISGVSESNNKLLKSVHPNHCLQNHVSGSRA